MKEFVYLMCPITTLIICQIIKFILESYDSKKLKWGRLFNGSGGMPSSHTSLTFSITFLIGLKLGFESPLFAIPLVYSLITAYDAMGLRRESGRQAAIINQILDELFSKESKTGIIHLKEQVGHQPLEVLAGIILGIGMSFLLSII